MTYFTLFGRNKEIILVSDLKLPKSLTFLDILMGFKNKGQP